MSKEIYIGILSREIDSIVLTVAENPEDARQKFEQMGEREEPVSGWTLERIGRLPVEWL